MMSFMNVLRKIGASPVTAIVWIIATLIFLCATFVIFMLSYTYFRMLSIPGESLNVDFDAIRESLKDYEKAEDVASFAVATLESILFYLRVTSILIVSMVKYFHLYFWFMLFYAPFTIIYLSFKRRNPSRKVKPEKQEVVT